MVDNARLIYPHIGEFIIVVVEDITHEPGTRIWKVILAARNPDRSSRVLVGAFDGQILEALVVLLIATAQMVRDIGA